MEKKKTVKKAVKKAVKKVVKKAVKKVVKKTIKKTANKRSAKKVAKRINTAYKKVSKKQAERLAPEEVIILEDSGMSLKEYNIFARRNGIVPIEEIAKPIRLTDDDVYRMNKEQAEPAEGKTINLQGTARIVAKMTDYGRDMQRKHQTVVDRANKMADEYIKQNPSVRVIGNGRLAAAEYKTTPEQRESLGRVNLSMLNSTRRIQPLPDDTRQDSKASCACPLCIPEPKPLKLKYRTRTARAVAAIRRTANNAWVRVSNRVGDFFMWFDKYK